MLSGLSLLPLLFALALIAPILVSPVSRRANLLVSQVALPIFGFYVATENQRHRRQQWRLRAAHVGVTHRVYASRTLLMAAVFGIAGSIFGVYVAAAFLSTFALSPETWAGLPPQVQFLRGVTSLDTLSLRELFVLLVLSSATIGTALALGVYWIRWYVLTERANTRATEIEATLPRTVAFIYALSRSGMAFPKVLETLARNEAVYGEAAREVGIAVRDMDAFGTDVLTALQSLSDRTPSENLEEFGENLSSVLGSGRNLSRYLHEQYERFQTEAAAQQQQYLELLSTLAEVYVTVLVAGPLFLITVLVVIGLVIADTLTVIRIIGYVAVPAISAAFVVYLGSITKSLRGVISRNLGTGAAADSHQMADRSTVGETARADGGEMALGWTVNAERLAAYDRLRWLRRWMNQPVRSILQNPFAVLVFTVPLGLVWVLTQTTVSVGPAESTSLLRVVVQPALWFHLGDSLEAVVAAADNHVVEVAIVSMAIISVIHEIRKRQLRAIERAMPDFLDRLASVNEAGLTIVQSLRRVSSSDLGPLGDEIQRTIRDIDVGADAESALRRMDRRTRSPMVSRSVTLLTNAMSASGDIAPVVRIAATEAQDSRRLARERQQEMLTYLVVIYISFFVFLGIVGALAISFIPAVEQASTGALVDSGGVGVTSGTFEGLRNVNTESYELMFFHITAIQGVCSGIIAGQLGEGDVADGIKHATFLLLLTYVVFLFI
ncbi:type II secretion system F family protein [Haloferax namakaokahaiae]|uniref:Type II secretion system F family protein n=1 Tax=Haloferax namakaokahaiae TaxID=1748331 RepID=A0ABD5ZFS0_9EURY